MSKEETPAGIHEGPEREVREFSQTLRNEEVDDPDFESRFVDETFVKSATSSREFPDDLAAAEAASESNIVGLSEDNKLVEMLNRAYPVYLGLLAGGNEAFSELLSRPFFHCREGNRNHRTLGKNPALLALELVFKPKERHEWTACSAYSPMLNYLALERVPPERFVEVMTRVTFAAAAERIRKLRRQHRGEAVRRRRATEPSQDPAGVQTSPALTFKLVCRGQADDSIEMTRLVTPKQFGAIHRVVEKAEEGKTLPALLLRVLQALVEADNPLP